MSLRGANGTPLATTQVGSTDEPSVVISEIVADVTNEGIEDLPPLGRSVDPDALDAVFATEDAVGRLSFSFAGHDVLLDSTGAVEVHRPGTITP